MRQIEKVSHNYSTLPPVVRHDAAMDGHALERLGHHIVSRRVELGYRNRTDLAASLQITVRTLADIENGVRRASPGTYAMLENKLAWAPGSIESRGAATAPNLATAPLPPMTLLPVPPPKSCCWSCAAASSGPRETPRGAGRLGRRPRPPRLPVGGGQLERPLTRAREEPGSIGARSAAFSP
jgi:hypothetical protein